MAISLHSDNLEGESTGHDYRLSDYQFRRTIEAGIIPEAGGVELRNGFLVLKSDRRGGHYPLSVDQYEAMAREGILTTDDRIELLEGWLVAKLTKSRRYVISKGLTFDALRKLLPPGWFLGLENPIDTIDSEPEPDLSIVRGVIRDYAERFPGPSETDLVVEVSDSSLFRDRTMKKRLYARAGLSIFWLINLVDHRIEVYTNPTGPVEKPDYLRRHDFGMGEQIPLVIDGREVGRLSVSDILV